jgi:hypothetical protein
MIHCLFLHRLKLQFLIWDIASLWIALDDVLSLLKCLWITFVSIFVLVGSVCSKKGKIVLPYSCLDFVEALSYSALPRMMHHLSAFPQLMHLVTLQCMASDDAFSQSNPYRWGSVCIASFNNSSVWSEHKKCPSVILLWRSWSFIIKTGKISRHKVKV